MPSCVYHKFLTLKQKVFGYFGGVPKCFFVKISQSFTKSPLVYLTYFSPQYGMYLPTTYILVEKLRKLFFITHS